MGLIGGIARVAVASGTWTAVSNRVSRRQAERWSQQDQQHYQAAAPAPAAPAPAASAPSDAGQDRIAQLKELAELKQNGILTEEEFAREKAKILAG
jgi:hypothetical protein